MLATRSDSAASSGLALATRAIARSNGVDGPRVDPAKAASRLSQLFKLTTEFSGILLTILKPEQNSSDLVLTYSAHESHHPCAIETSFPNVISVVRIMLTSFSDLYYTGMLDSGF